MTFNNILFYTLQAKTMGAFYLKILPENRSLGRENDIQKIFLDVPNLLTRRQISFTIFVRKEIF